MSDDTIAMITLRHVQVVQLSLWYQILGMSLVPYLDAPAAADQNINLSYIKVTSLLPFSIYSDASIASLREAHNPEMVSSLNLRHSLRKVYSNARYKSPSTVLQQTRFVFPDDAEDMGGKEEYRNQFMVGENVIIGSYNVEQDKMNVYLPSSKVNVNLIFSVIYYRTNSI